MADADSNTGALSRNAAFALTSPSAPAGRSELTLEEDLRRRARRLGFAACAVTSAEDLACGPLLAEWLDAGRHGDMTYLAEKHERRLRPSAALAGARSAIVVAASYAPSAPADPSWKELLRGRVAAYALGSDYHEHVATRLEALAAWLRERSGSETVVHVDGGPLVEKELARRAGLGWYGRNTNLLRPGAGSWFMLGVIVTTAPLAADPPFSADHCGTCRACIPACPTGALDSGPTIDARLCISYLTIEHRGPLPPALRASIGNWVFGCDLCQDVCPWNGSAAVSHPRQGPWLPGWLLMSEADFREHFAGSALLRPKRRGLARNAAVALGNSGNPAAVDFLAAALSGHDEPIVRAHSAWGLGRIAGRIARKALMGAAAREQVPPVRREIDAALAAATAAAAVGAPTTPDRQV